MSDLAIASIVVGACFVFFVTAGATGALLREHTLFEFDDGLDWFLKCCCIILWPITLSVMLGLYLVARIKRRGLPKAEVVRK